MMLTVMVGCSRSSEDPGPKVVASVNGHSLTAEELEARAVNIATLSCHKQGASAKKKFAQIKDFFRKGYPKIWVENRLLDEYARQNGLEVADDLLQKCRQVALRNFGRKGETYEALVGMKGLNAGLWEDQVRSDALRQVVERHWAKLYPTNLPSTYVEDLVARVEARNRAMAVTNALVYAKATNVWEKLKAGADFAETARKYTEIREEAEDDGEWAVVDAKFLVDDPKLLRTLQSMTPGEISPPVEGDNGLMIARLDHYEPDDGISVSRIFFHLPLFLEAAPRETILKTAHARHAKDVFKRKLAELVAGSQAVYASGPVRGASTEQQTKEQQAKGK